MRDRKGIVLCILVGSFCVYCGQSVMTEMSHGTTSSSTASGGSTAVGSAMGDACCTPPEREQPTVIYDDLVSPAPVAGSTSTCVQHTPVFDISAYRRIVIHTPSCGFSGQVRNGKAGFVAAAQFFCPTTEGASILPPAMTLDATLGHDLRVVFHEINSLTNATLEGPASCDSNPIPVTIVGYKNP